MLGLLWFLIQILIFVVLWGVSLSLLWLLLSRALEGRVSGRARVLGCGLATATLLFELLATGLSEAAAQASAVERGKPLTCYGIPSPFWWADSCGEFYRLTSVSILWRLNPIKMVICLLSGLSSLLFGGAGESVGAFVGGFLDTLPLWVRVFVVGVFSGLAALALLAHFGYRLSLFWSALDIRPERRPAKQPCKERADMKGKYIVLR